MNGKYKIRVKNKADALKTMDILIKNGYLFFEAHRYDNLKKITDYVDLEIIQWLITGHSDCNRVFGTSAHDGNDMIFGDKTDYEIVTVKEFIALKKK